MAAGEAEIKATEQPLLKPPHNVGVREILSGKKPGIINPPAGRKVNRHSFEWMMRNADFEHGSGVRASVAVELAKLCTCRGIQAQFGRRLIIEARVYLLESLVRSRVIHPVVPERPTKAHGHFWKPAVIKVKASRNRVVTDVTGVEVGVRIKFSLEI